MPCVSMSVSVGNPVKKYNLARDQPEAKADSTAPYRSSSVMSLLMTVRSRQVPASGAKVNPLRRPPATLAARPTVNASTRNDGRLTVGAPHAVGSGTIDEMTDSIPLKSAVDSEVRLTSLYPVRFKPSTIIERTCSAGRSRTGRVIMPAWQKRHPRVQPRKTSTASRSWTTSVNGANGLRG